MNVVDAASPGRPQAVGGKESPLRRSDLESGPRAVEHREQQRPPRAEFIEVSHVMDRERVAAVLQPLHVKKNHPPPPIPDPGAAG